MEIIKRHYIYIPQKHSHFLDHVEPARNGSVIVLPDEAVIVLMDDAEGVEDTQAHSSL